MFIKELTSSVVDGWGRVVRQQQTFGMYKNYHIGIEKSIYKGKILSKTFLIWNENMEKLIKKQRTESGRFERIG